jgi:phosphoribosylaminoimidazole carboxylase PurK protein
MPIAATRVGIIGDGQLARMLALAAYPLGIRPVLLTADANSSAGQVCPLQVRGSMHSKHDLHALLSQVDVAVIESEFVNCDMLEGTGLHQKVVPSLAAIRKLQNKLEQKRLLKSLGIATSSFVDASELDAWIQRRRLAQEPFVLKFATLGYDGKGVLVYRNYGDDKKLEAFRDTADSRGIEIFGEDLVVFKQELAMIACRRKDGVMETYPLVASIQKQGICHMVLGPAVCAGVDGATETKAQQVCKKIADTLGLIGVFAVEFFLDASQNLLVNEIAPRVHNSGHYSMDLGGASQFSNHWHAVLNLKLLPVAKDLKFGMINLLGPSGIIAKESCPPPRFKGTTSSIHWYGKSGMSPHRKLGHINYVGDRSTAVSLADISKQLEESATAWEQAVRMQFPPTNMELPL